MTNEQTPEFLAITDVVDDTVLEVRSGFPAETGHLATLLMRPPEFKRSSIELYLTVDDATALRDLLDGLLSNATEDIAEKAKRISECRHEHVLDDVCQGCGFFESSAAAVERAVAKAGQQ